MKTKVGITIIKKVIDSIDNAIESIDQLAEIMVIQTKTLQRIEHLLDEQADIQAQTRDNMVDLIDLTKDE